MAQLLPVPSRPSRHHRHRHPRPQSLAHTSASPSDAPMVYHSHTPEAAGMILAVKELVEVENVPLCIIPVPITSSVTRREVSTTSIGNAYTISARIVMLKPIDIVYVHWPFPVSFPLKDLPKSIEDVERGAAVLPTLLHRCSKTAKKYYAREEAGS
ncbi:hypothetical protein H4582DRAFT_2063108 [Lactarius indigo]|nr:hypothetical protein H4582DRAFT_2063108 [Lactarius indigo]